MTAALRSYHPPCRAGSQSLGVSRHRFYGYTNQIEERGSKMDSFTVAPELKGTRGDIVAARIEVPILVAMTYGVVEFVRLGWSQDHYLYTYAPVLGGVAASVGLFTYFFIVSVRRKRSWKNLLVLLGFLPYLYALYIMGVLGLYTIFEGIIGVFSFWSMIGGVFWVFIGFHLIYRFYLMTEIVRRHDEKSKTASEGGEAG
jgi:hypothetical protein